MLVSARALTTGSVAERITFCEEAANKPRFPQKMALLRERGGE